MTAAYKKLRVVLDTNVLISALGFLGRETGKIWDLAEESGYELFLSEFILDELLRNLAGKAGLSENDAAEVIERVRDFSVIAVPKSKVSVIRQKDADNRILECAVAANADVIVTGNMRHIRPLGSFRGIAILTPREFLDKHFPGI